MVTLIAILSLTFFAGFLNDGDAGAYRILLPLATAACIPWAAWLDLSGLSETGAKSPFVSALLMAVAAPIYMGLLPSNVANIIAVGEGAPGPLRFGVEFSVMLFAPLSLIGVPVIRLFVPARWSNVNYGAFPSSRLYQALAVLFLGLMALVYAANPALNVEGIFESLGMSTGAGVWRQTAPIMVPIWLVGTLFSTFALAWGQLAEGLPRVGESSGEG